jgi:protein-S-isoprenylcysteine O-methyltransferase Ste14
MSLKSKFLLRFFLVLILFAALLFIPAGSWRFWRGWAWLAAFFLPNLLFFFYLSRRDPQLLERRMQLKEKAGTQNLIKAVGGLIFFSSLLLPGFDYRLGWSRTFPRLVPLWVTLISLALVLSGFLLVFWVLRVNSFAASTIQVEAGQPVISSGPYRIVRHPMYCGLVVSFLATPLALGSCITFPAFTLLIPVMVFRILTEEKTLCQELPGYYEYCLRTPFRLVPFIW